MSGYHEAFAITGVGQDAIVVVKGQFMVFSTMQIAAHNLGVLAEANPGREFTIRRFKMAVPWVRDGL